MIDKGQIILLLDWQLTSKKHWLQVELENQGFAVFPIGIPDYSNKNRTTRWRKIILWWQFFVLGWKGAKTARRLNGTVVSWNFICGAFTALFIGRDENKVVALNIIARDKGLVNRIIRKLVYKHGFSSKKTIGTVNSEELKRDYEKEFNVGADQLYILHDPCPPSFNVAAPNMDDLGYVFSGGEAARDWVTLINVARRCPSIPFKVIARRMNWQLPDCDLPQNVAVQFDTDENEFYLQLKKARLVLLPLKGKVTAGLIVIIRSILSGKLIITTQTSSTSTYFPEEEKYLLVKEGDYIEMADLLNTFWSDNAKRIKAANNLQKYVITNFSCEEYAKEVGKLILQACKD